MNTTKLKKTVTLMSVIALSAVASAQVLAEENIAIEDVKSNLLVYSDQLTTDITIDDSTATEDIGNTSSPSGEEEPVDPGAVPPATTVTPDPEPTPPATTVTPAPPSTTVTDPSTIPSTSNSSTTTTTVASEPAASTSTAPSTTVTTPTTTEPSTKGDQPSTTTEPAAEPIPLDQNGNFNPFVSSGGQTIVGTNAGSIVVQYSDGTTQQVAPEAVGATVQSDGSITVKDSEGKLKRLPNTGEESSIFSVLGLSILGSIGFLKKKKFI